MADLIYFEDIRKKDQETYEIFVCDCGNETFNLRRDGFCQCSECGYISEMMGCFEKLPVA